MGGKRKNVGAEGNPKPAKVVRMEPRAEPVSKKPPRVDKGGSGSSSSAPYQQTLPDMGVFQDILATHYRDVRLPIAAAQTLPSAQLRDT
ncbi:unnamed protein product [Linum trigynum]|uniref:Uncharacterized protein n=1 Tax=Linum trigynum TaxID=586398 RepID=A0AAV2D8M4_9ROSI